MEEGSLAGRRAIWELLYTTELLSTKNRKRSE